MWNDGSGLPLVLPSFKAGRSSHNGSELAQGKSPAFAPVRRLRMKPKSHPFTKQEQLPSQRQDNTNQIIDSTANGGSYPLLCAGSRYVVVIRRQESSVPQEQSNWKGRLAHSCLCARWWLLMSLGHNTSLVIEQKKQRHSIFPSLDTGQIPPSAQLQVLHTQFSLSSFWMKRWTLLKPRTYLCSRRTAAKTEFGWIYLKVPNQPYIHKMTAQTSRKYFPPYRRKPLFTFSLSTAWWGN